MKHKASARVKARVGYIVVEDVVLNQGVNSPAVDSKEGVTRSRVEFA